MLGSATAMKVSFFRGLNACTVSLLPVPVSAILCLKPKSIEMSDKNWPLLHMPLCVWSSKALWRLTKTGLFCNCISSNCNILNLAYCQRQLPCENTNQLTIKWQSFLHLRTLKNESTTIKKKEKVCNTTQQLNIAMSFF
jgi:hypothetical protein